MLFCLNAYQKRLLCATLGSLLAVVGLYGVLLAGSGGSNGSRNNAAVPPAVVDDSATTNTAVALPKLPITATEQQAAVATRTANKQASAADCPKHPPVYELNGKPIWIAGYPGSGFDLIAPIVAAFAGLTVVDVYRHHTCSTRIRDGAAVTGACMTHWPILQKDSPAHLAMQGQFYHTRAVFVIRNPMNAIPSYHTRWWGAQKHIKDNHEQPPEEDWKTWRDAKLDEHLNIWKKSITNWQRGIPAAGISGVSFFLPYEGLVSNTTGPLMTRKLAQQFELAQHDVVADNYMDCLWGRCMDHPRAHGPKKYEYTYTSQQQRQFLTVLDDLLVLYEASEPKLIQILQKYRKSVATQIRLEDATSSSTNEDVDADAVPEFVTTSTNP